jgi:flagellar basal body-associated protein FliL
VLLLLLLLFVVVVVVVVVVAVVVAVFFFSSPHPFTPMCSRQATYTKREEAKCLDTQSSSLATSGRRV